MNEEQRARWALLQQVIDIEKYEAHCPLVLHQIGWLKTTRPNPNEIEWLNGKAEVVSLLDMPAEFARFKSGQWFEAVVECDRKTLSVRKVLDVRARQPLQPMSQQELAEFMGSLPKSEGTPEPVKDWTTR